MRAYNEDDDVGCGLPSRLVPLLAPRLDASEGSVRPLDAFSAIFDRDKTRQIAHFVKRLFWAYTRTPNAWELTAALLRTTERVMQDYSA